MGQSAERVLVYLIEDNHLIRASLVAALVELANVEIVAEAVSEREATDWLKAHPDQWQIAVIDLFLAQGSGLGVLRACRTRRAGQKAVVLSNYVTGEMRARCNALGADAIFDKSTEVDEFIAYCKDYAGSPFNGPGTP
jgi:DNA-binding NarL/FixJ family response regulator